MDIEVSRRQFFALFAREAHGAKNPKKCRGPCGPPAGVRPCASKERRGGFRAGGAEACGMESGVGAEASGHGMRPVGGCWGAREALRRDVTARTEESSRVAVLRSETGRHFPRRLRPICARDRWRQGGSPCGMATVLRNTFVGRRRTADDGHQREGRASRAARRGGRCGKAGKGLDQLLESIAHADQLDPLDVEGILALRSISQRCAERIDDAARILEAQNEVFYAEGQEPVLNAARRKGTLRLFDSGGRPESGRP